MEASSWSKVVTNRVVYVQDMESEEREAVLNASLPKVQVETSEKLLTTKVKSEDQHHGRKRGGKVSPIEINRPFKGKQLRQKALTDLETAILNLEELNSAKYKDFLFFTGLWDVNDNDLIIMDTSKLPSKTDFPDKMCFKETINALNFYSKAFIDANVTTDNFVLIIHGLTNMPSHSIGRKLYKLLKESFGDRLQSCILHKPTRKLNVLIRMCRPFLQIKMKKKLFTTRNESDFEEHGIAESILDYR